MVLLLILCATLGLTGQSSPNTTGAFAKSCDAGGCGYLVLRHGEVRFLLQFTNGQIGSDVDVGRYLESAQRLVPKTEAAIRELRTTSGWRVIISAFIEGSSFALRARMINREGKIMDTLRMPPSIVNARAGALFSGNHQIFAVTASAYHAYTNSWWAFLLPDAGYPRLIGHGYGCIEDVRSGTAAPGLAVTRRQPVDNDANRVLTVSEFWTWYPKIQLLILTQH